MPQDEQGIEAAAEVEESTGLCSDDSTGGPEFPGSVAEARKYRRRAQTAERNAEKLARELRSSQQELEVVRTDAEIIKHLMKVGVEDLEVASLLVRERLSQQGEDEQNLQAAIDQVQQARPHLFRDGRGVGGQAFAGLTAGARISGSGGAGMLSSSARQAGQTGSARDVQDYMRLRRTLR